MQVEKTGETSAAAETQDDVTKTPAEGEVTKKTEADAAAPEGDEPEGDEGEETTHDDDADASEAARKLAKRKRSLNDRIGQVTAKYRESERARARVDRELADLKAKMAKGYDPDANPDLNYTLDQREAQRLESQRKTATDDLNIAKAEAWKERATLFAEENPDFEKVAYSAPIGDETSELISDMEEGPAIAYHLGKNPAEARRIDRLPASQKPFALGRLAERVTGEPMQRTTTAPKPISGGVSGNKSAAAKPKYESMSPADYAKVVAAEEAERNKGR